ncbi:MAG TPA: DHA2 family efflux MFS transporter permease subunit [Polyangiaceae bacterium]|jgi:EmrB/QacA subfamily drug resistance transporter|nr:DHA2 family efflux MFS transporter permease subunit [Polyangiaceae bacterium]
MLEAVLPAPPTKPCPGAHSDPRWSLIVAILGSTMAFVDSTVVNVAVPVMQRDLSARVDQIQWVVESYALVLAALVLVGGALGDQLGRRRVFVVGTAVFSLASAAAGLAPGVDSLIAARTVQGIGAALLVPGSLALIGAAYPEATRPGAIGTWSAATSVASAIGPAIGGWAIAHFSYRVVFFLNLPVGLAVVALSTLYVPETRDPDARPGLDWSGAVLATVGLGAIVWALIDAPTHGGLGATRELVPACAGVLALGAFFVVEARAPSPMVPLSLFRSRTFTGTNLLTLLLYAALGAFFFFLPFNLIQVQRYSPTEAGAALVPFVILISVLSRLAGKVVARYGPRLPLVVGPAVAAAGFALTAVPSVGGSYWGTFFAGIVVLGVGMGITVAPLTAAVMGSVDDHHAGVASGVNNAVSRAAGLLAVAALGVVLVSRFNAALDRDVSRFSQNDDLVPILAKERLALGGAELPASLAPPLRGALRAALDAAFVDGFRALMLVCAAMAALSSVAALIWIDGKPGVGSPDAGPSEAA